MAEIAKRNTLVVIGWIGIKTAYLNISLPEAKALYESEYGEIDDEHCKIFGFNEQFGAYDAWDTEKE